MPRVSLSSFLLYVTVCLGLSASAFAVTPYTFKPVRVHGGGYVDGIVFHPGQANLIYARTDMGGAYRWDNASSSWTPLTDFLNRDQADYMGDLALAVDPSNVNKVYLLTGKYTQSWAGNGALLSSSDQGATWTVTTLPFKVGGNEDGRGAGERLAVDPNLGSILFAGSNLSALYKSVNSGGAWAAVGAFPSSNITFVTFDKSSGSSGSATPNIYVGVNATTNNLYRSTDGGASWALLAGQPSGNIPMRAAWGQGRLYITYSNALGPNGSTAGAVWRFDTAGSAWTNLNPPAGQGGWCGVGVYPGANDQVALATLDRWWPADEIYRSTNSGGAWTAKLTGATLDESATPWVVSGSPHWITDIAIDPFNADHALWVTGYGVYRTTNFSAATPTWAFASAGIEQTVPLQLVSPSSGAPLLSAMGDVDGFRHNDPDVVPTLRHQPEVGTTLAIAMADSLPSKLVKAYNASPYGAYSTDGGSNWTAFAAFPGGATGGGTRSIAISADGASLVWCPPGGTCSRSTNNGGAWTAVTGGLPAGLEPVADRVNANKFYAIDWATGNLWASTNGGAAWSTVATGLGTLPSYQAGDASLKAALGKDGEVWITTGAGGLWRSTASGASPSKLANVSVAYEVSTGLGLTAGVPAIYLFGTVGGVRGFYRSDDTGANWVRLNDNLHQYGWIHDFSGDPRIYGRLYLCAEGRGILYGDIPAAGSPTPSATRTATLTATRTTTPSATRSASPSATRSVTLTGTPSATATQTNAAASATTSPTRSATRSVTPSATPSRTPSMTASASPSATASATRSATRSSTASPTASPSRTGTPSATLSASRSVTPTITATFTDVPVGSSETATPTVSPSFSASPTETATETASLTATLSDSPTESSSPTGTDTETITETVTATVSETATATIAETATQTATQTVTESVTLSATQTLSPADTASLTATLTVTQPETPSPSVTLTPSATLTPAASASLTAYLSPLNTASKTPSPSTTPTQTPSPVASASPSPGAPSPSVTPSATSTVSASTATPSATPPVSGAAATTGSLRILQAVAFPQPDPSQLRVRLDGPADVLIVERYSPAYILMDRLEWRGLVAGWNAVPLPALWSSSQGLSFIRLRARLSAVQSPPVAPIRLVYLP